MPPSTFISNRNTCSWQLLSSAVPVLEVTAASVGRLVGYNIAEMRWIVFESFIATQTFVQYQYKNSNLSQNFFVGISIKLIKIIKNN